MTEKLSTIRLCEDKAWCEKLNSISIKRLSDTKDDTHRHRYAPKGRLSAEEGELLERSLVNADALNLCADLENAFHVACVVWRQLDNHETIKKIAWHSMG